MIASVKTFFKMYHFHYFVFNAINRKLLDKFDNSGFYMSGILTSILDNEVKTFSLQVAPVALNGCDRLSDTKQRQCSFMKRGSKIRFDSK